jgi:hypothetical protein
VNAILASMATRCTSGSISTPRLGEMGRLAHHGGYTITSLTAPTAYFRFAIMLALLEIDVRSGRGAASSSTVARASANAGDRPVIGGTAMPRHPAGNRHRDPCAARTRATRCGFEDPGYPLTYAQDRQQALRDRPGCPTTSSRIRPSKRAGVVFPILSPKPRRMPRKLISTS